VRAGQQVERKEYDDAGNVTAVFDALNRKVKDFEYDGRNLLEKTTFHNDEGVTTFERREYDGNGNLIYLYDEENKLTAFEYDNENREVRSTFEGETRSRVYDPRSGVLIATLLPESQDSGRFEGTQKSFAYDGLDRLTRVEEEDLGPTAGGFLATTFGYDDNGNLRHIYAPRDNAGAVSHVEYVYDDLNRRTQHIQHKDGGNLVTGFQYDNVGNLTRVTDAMGRVFQYQYDLLNRRINAGYPDVPSPLMKLASIDFDYDGNSNLTHVQEAKTRFDGVPITDVIDNTYDSFDRLTLSDRRGLHISYTYDQNGNRLSVGTPNGSTSYEYTLRNQIKKATLGSDVVSFGYLDDGKLSHVQYPNGTTIDYAYHATNRIQSITHRSGGAVLASHTYDHDKNGNRRTQVENLGGETETTAYDYDPMNRLSAYTISRAGAPGYPLRKEFSFEGYNRKTEKTFLEGEVSEEKTYTYDETNWLTQVVAQPASGSPYTIGYLYDGNGNTLVKDDSRSTDGKLKFDYDARDELVQVSKVLPGSETILGQSDYDHEGNRVRQRYSDRGAVDYFHDGSSVLEEHNAADDSLLAYYEYADRLVALAQPAGKQYYHHDALGSTVALTDAVGATQATYRLDPWGNIREESGLSDNRFIFTGKEHDRRTGLVYFGARFYDPETARFITQDTYLGEPNQPPSLHRYLYAYSNPTAFFDVTGRATECVWGECQTVPGEYTSTDGSVEVDRRGVVRDIGIQTPESMEYIVRSGEPPTPSGLTEITVESRRGQVEQFAKMPAYSPRASAFPERGPITRAWIEANQQQWNPESSFFESIGYGFLSLGLALPAVMQEGIRVILNTPSDIESGARRGGEALAAATIFAGRGQTENAWLAAGEASGGFGESMFIAGTMVLPGPKGAGKAGSGGKVPKPVEASRGKGQPSGSGKPPSGPGAEATVARPAGTSAGGPIGFAPGTGYSAFPPNRLQHASRHLIEEQILPNWSKATGQQFTELGIRIVENPTATFDHVLRGGQPVKGFLGQVGDKPVAVMVFKEGEMAGQVATVVVPSPAQLAEWGLR